MKDIHDMPGHLARRFQQIAAAVFHAEMASTRLGLTPVQYAAMVTLSKQPGIDQATLASIIAYDRATIGGVVDRLVQKGLVTRVVSATDRRARVLRLTDSGKAAIVAAEPAVEAAQDAMLRGLSRTERSQLRRLLAKAIAASDEQRRPPRKS